MSDNIKALARPIVVGLLTFLAVLNPSKTAHAGSSAAATYHAQPAATATSLFC